MLSLIIFLWVWGGGGSVPILDPWFKLSEYEVVCIVFKLKNLAF